MGALVTLIVTKLFELLAPKIEAKLDEYAPKLLTLIEQKFEEWLPKIMKTVVVSVAQAAGQLVVDTGDKITDIIPGNLDDQILDPIVRSTMTELEKLLGIKLR